MSSMLKTIVTWTTLRKNVIPAPDSDPIFVLVMTENKNPSRKETWKGSFYSKNVP
jgi:hypothetical protein